MMETAPPLSEETPLDRGLRALCGIAAYYRIGADPVQLARELALGAREANEGDLIRAAKVVGRAWSRRSPPNGSRPCRLRRSSA
jgi:ATP-binding cassette, subfamily B, bacterial HlyB/CyaB